MVPSIIHSAHTQRNGDHYNWRLLCNLGVVTIYLRNGYETLLVLTLNVSFPLEFLVPRMPHKSHAVQSLFEKSHAHSNIDRWINIQKYNRLSDLFLSFIQKFLAMTFIKILIRFADHEREFCKWGTQNHWFYHVNFIDYSVLSSIAVFSDLLIWYSVAAYLRRK